MSTLPKFTLYAGAKDVTSAFSPLLSSLTITDETGFRSDTLEIKIADPKQTIELPRRDSLLTVHLGYADGVMRDFGSYAVSEVSGEGPPDVLTIRATATPMSGGRKPDEGVAPVKASLQELRSVSYDPGEFSKLLAEVCIRSDLIFRAPQEVWHLPLPHITQSAESDLALVSRLALDRGCVVKMQGNILVLTRRSAEQTVSGKPLPPRGINPTQISQWNVTFGPIKPYRSAIARYHDKARAVTVEVRAGTESPVYEHPYDFPDRTAAEAGARAVLQRAVEGNSSINITMPMDVSIIAEQPVILGGFRDGLNGKWLVDRVEHTLQKSGAITSFTGRETA